jgi:hypothetical protein
MAERLIDAEAFEADVRKRYCKDCNKGSIFCTVCETENMLSEIEEAPTIEAKPVVHAHWYLKDNAAFHQCSNCEKFAPDCDDGFSIEEMLSEYCPHCGALMDEKIDE